MHLTRSFFRDRKLDLPLNSFRTTAAGFCKRLFVNFFTARESNGRQNFDG